MENVIDINDFNNMTTGDQLLNYILKKANEKEQQELNKLSLHHKR